MQTKEFPLKLESYEIIGLCMEVQNNLGYGFSEVVYKDALEIEFENKGILFSRERALEINYKGLRLKHRFFADFTAFDQIIIEIKSSDKGITGDHVAQTLNYLQASGYRVGLIINFGKRRLEYQRLIAK